MRQPAAVLTAQRRWKLQAHQADAPVVDAPEELFASELRTYDQSMSGRNSSQRTSPPDSRSIATTRSPPILMQPTEIALRKYPIVVEQRFAKAACSTGASEFKYDRSFSITDNLPLGKIKSTPVAHLPLSNSGYDAPMTAVDPHAAKMKERLHEVRRRRLRGQLESYATMTEFAEAIKEPLNYVSRLVQLHKKGRKNLGEGKARRIEVLLGKPTGWLDIDEGKTQAVVERNDWPFRFPRKIWDDLQFAEQRKAEALLLTYIQGMEAQREQRKETG